LAARHQNTENAELAAAIEPTQQGKRRSATDLVMLLKNIARPPKALAALLGDLGTWPVRVWLYGVVHRSVLLRITRWWL